MIFLIIIKIPFYMILLIVAIIFLLTRAYFNSATVRTQETIMPQKGYCVKCSFIKPINNFKIQNDLVIPILFLNAQSIPVSTICCFRIENVKRKQNKILCDIKLLDYGKNPEQDSNNFYIFNKGQIIGVGEVVSPIEVRY